MHSLYYFLSFIIIFLRDDMLTNIVRVASLRLTMRRNMQTWLLQVLKFIFFLKVFTEIPCSYLPESTILGLFTGFMFLTEVPKQGTGWKTPLSPELSEHPLSNLNSSGTRQLFENITFAYDEIFMGLDKVNYTTTYSDNYGKIFFLQPELGSITTNQDTTLEINLNASLNFFMVEDIVFFLNFSDFYSSGTSGWSVWIHNSKPVCS